MAAGFTVRKACMCIQVVKSECKVSGCTDFTTLSILHRPERHTQLAKERTNFLFLLCLLFLPHLFLSHVFFFCFCSFIYVS